MNIMFWVVPMVVFIGLYCLSGQKVTDPLILRTIQNLSNDTPLFPRSLLADWTFDNRHLYYKE